MKLLHKVTFELPFNLKIELSIERERARKLKPNFVFKFNPKSDLMFELTSLSSNLTLEF